MTTIVFHAGIIAYDSRESCDDGQITDNNVNKCTIKNGIYFFMCGYTPNDAEIVKAYIGEDHSTKFGGRAIIHDKHEVYIAGICNEKGFWKQNITGRSRAIGSGENHAYTAIDMGCTAAEAVKMAMKRDAFTGGRVRTHKVRKQK